jgi:hypothetical protein
VHLVGFHYKKSCASLNFVYIIPNITFREQVRVGLYSLVNFLPVPGTRTYRFSNIQAAPCNLCPCCLVRPVSVTPDSWYVRHDLLLPFVQPTM